MKQITEDAVVEAYRRALQLRARRIHYETMDREETGIERNQRLEEITRHNDLELTYLAQQAG